MKRIVLALLMAFTAIAVFAYQPSGSQRHSALNMMSADGESPVVEVSLLSSTDLSGMAAGSSKTVLLGNPHKNNGYFLGYTGSAKVSTTFGASMTAGLATAETLKENGDYLMTLTKGNDGKFTLESVGHPGTYLMETPGFASTSFGWTVATNITPTATTDMAAGWAAANLVRLITTGNNYLNSQGNVANLGFRTGTAEWSVWSFYEVKAVTNPLIHEAQAVLEAAQNVYAETQPGIAKGEEVTVNTNQFSSNAPCRAEGDITKLIDGNAATFFHSDWQGTFPTTTPHELYVNGLDAQVTKYFLTYLERTGAAYDFVTRMDVYGGTVETPANPNYDAATFNTASSKLATINMPNTTHPGSGEVMFDLGDTGYSALRFQVTGTTSSRGYFHFGDFHLFKTVATTPVYDVSQDLINALTSAMSTLQSKIDDETVTQADIDAVNTAMNNITSAAQVTYTVNITGVDGAYITYDGNQYHNGDQINVTGTITASEITPQEVTDYSVTQKEVNGLNINVHYSFSGSYDGKVVRIHNTQRGGSDNAITNRDDHTVYGTAIDNNAVNQLWLIEKSGDQCFFRNVKTGRYLQSKSTTETVWTTGTPRPSALYIIDQGNGVSGISYNQAGTGTSFAHLAQNLRIVTWNSVTAGSAASGWTIDIAGNASEYDIYTVNVVGADNATITSTATPAGGIMTRTNGEAFFFAAGTQITDANFTASEVAGYALQSLTLENNVITATYEPTGSVITADILPSTGTLYKSGTQTGQTWNNTWVSTQTSPQFTLQTSLNNMQANNGALDLRTGSGGSCDFTLSSTSGYKFVGMNFKLRNATAGQNQTLQIGSHVYTSNDTDQAIEITNLSAASLVLHTTGNNSGILMKEWQVLYTPRFTNIQYSTSEEQHWYYITSVANNDYCRDKVMYYDAGSDRIKYGTSAYQPNMVWSFWKDGNGKVAIKSFEGYYFGTPGNDSGNSSQFGKSDDANYVYTIAEYASGQFTITADGGAPLHAQQDGSVIVRWPAAANNASLWNFEEVPVSDGLTLDGTLVEQGKISTGIGNKNVPIIRSKLIVSGLQGAAPFTQVTGTLNGTTNLSDVTAVKVYFASDAKELDLNTNVPGWRVPNGELFGTATVDGSGNWTVTGSKSLGGGTHYLWVVLDIADNAVEGRSVDATITNYTFDGNVVAEANGNPQYSATIFLSEGTVLKPFDQNSKYWRIPAITTTKDGKRLVAVTDKRFGSNGDLPNQIDVVAQYSDDMGKTWSAPVVIAGNNRGGDDADYGHGDASIVTNMKNGDIVVIVTSGTQGFFYSSASNPNHWKTITSHDNGETWDFPVDHTNSLFGSQAPQNQGWGSAFSGSGAALQMRDGTLVSPLVTRETDKGNVQNIYLLLSDDGGENWYSHWASATAGGDEPKVLERNNGDLAMSIRHSGYNYYNYSSDKGATWHLPSGTQFTTGISGNACDGEYMVWASTLDGNYKNIAFQTLPNNGNRQNVSIVLSEDEGATFGTPKTICPRGSAYSATTVLPDGTLGCYYEETGVSGADDAWTMRFVRFSLDWASNNQMSFSQNTDGVYHRRTVTDQTEDVSVTAVKYGTYASEYALDFTDSPMKAYVCSGSDDNNKLIMHPVEKVAARTGLLIYAEEAGTYQIPVYTGSDFTAFEGESCMIPVLLEDVTSGNALVVPQTDGSNTNYILQNKTEGGLKFYKVNSGGNRITPHHAYIQLPNGSVTAKEWLDIADDPTGIFDIVNGQRSTVNGGYDLSGRKVNADYRGVVIRDGRKVLVK